MDDNKFISLNPLHAMVYTVAGYSGNGLVIEGTASTAARQMMADAQSLINGTALLSDVTEKYTGDSDELPVRTGDDLPFIDDKHFYTKRQIMAMQKYLAAKITDKDGPEYIQKIQVKINQWSALGMLNDQQRALPEGKFNAMNKQKTADTQLDKENLQGSIQAAQPVCQSLTFFANLFQQGFA